MHEVAQTPREALITCNITWAFTMSCIASTVCCRVGLFICSVVCWFLMFRLFGKGRILGLGDLPVEVRGWSREVSEVYPRFLKPSLPAQRIGMPT